MKPLPEGVLDRDGWDLIQELDTLPLNSWEAEFCDSCLKQLRTGWTLTPKQRAKAEEILEEGERSTMDD